MAKFRYKNVVFAIVQTYYISGSDHYLQNYGDGRIHFPAVAVKISHDPVEELVGKKS